MVMTLRLGQLNRPGQVVSVYRTFYPPGHRFPLHRHDFPELFFIESGRGEQVMPHETVPLAAGDLGVVDAAAEHELVASSEAMVLVNIAFSQRFLDGLRPYVHARDWPWVPGRAPVRRLDEARQAFVGEWIERLCQPRVGRTELAVFLLDLLRRLRDETAAPASEPRWLSDALAHLDRPEVLVGGVRALARLAGRAPDSMGRAVRRARGCTTVALINRARMAWFARQLRLTRTSIAQLAVECGLPNLSHCYRLFNAAYGCSPRRYRLRYQGGVVERPQRVDSNARRPGSRSPGTRPTRLTKV